MSLINDALKKAQKRHAQGPAAPLPPPVPGGAAPGGSPARNQPPSSRLFALFALSAVVLVALSVLATVYLLRRPVAVVPVAVQPPPAPVLAEKTAPPAAAKIPAPSAAVVVPTSPAAAPAPPVAAAPLSPPPAKTPPPVAPAAVSVAAATPAAPPAIQPPMVSLAPPPLDPTKPDPKIAAYVDALQVAGVRITSNGGKVLMNDRVYRQNDVVDRLLGLRLKKVEEDTLIFVDERGVTYTKNF